VNTEITRNKTKKIKSTYNDHMEPCLTQHIFSRHQATTAKLFIRDKQTLHKKVQGQKSVCTKIR